MNWEAIKYIYKCVLVHNNKIKYLGGSKYSLTKYFDNGQKFWEVELENCERHGKSIGWTYYGIELYNEEYVYGKLVK